METFTETSAGAHGERTTSCDSVKYCVNKCWENIHKTMIYIFQQTAALGDIDYLYPVTMQLILFAQWSYEFLEHPYSVFWTTWSVFHKHITYLISVALDIWVMFITMRIYLKNMERKFKKMDFALMRNTTSWIQ